jgi:hypothetical protein
MTMTLRPSSTATGDDEQRDALSAPVRDPLWLLARQWQTGAFIAADAGTPVHVSLAHTGEPITVAGAPLTGPIEPVVEAEPLPTVNALDTGSRVRLAAELVRRLRETGLAVDKIAAVRTALAQAFPLRPAAPASPLLAFVGRLPDPAGLLSVLAPVLAADGRGGPFPTLPGVDPADRPAATAVETAVRAWYAWTAAQVAPTGTPDAGSDPATWDRLQLEYRFTASAALPAGTVNLQASGYDGLGVDWYSFDRDPVVGGAATAISTTVEVHPVLVTYPGMPRPRFWELEDGDVNLDALRASSDTAHAVLATFAHEYANDWFLLPLEVPPCVCVITKLTVTDTFGTTTRVPTVAAIDADAGPWRLWDLTCTDDHADQATGARLFLPTAPPALEGPVAEEVLVARDEMANLAWVIELITRNDDGANVDRYKRWLQLRPPSDPTFNPATRGAANSYRLGTTLPDFWYPLVTATAADGKPLLALAELPPEATGVSDAGVRGQLVSHAEGTRLADEEASREGTRLSRRDRVTLSPTGIVVWRARTKGPGQGESSSGLRFDVLQ